MYFLLDTWADEMGFKFVFSFCFVCELMELCHDWSGFDSNIVGGGGLTKGMKLDIFVILHIIKL